MKVLYPRKSDKEQLSWAEDLRKLCSEATEQLTIVSPWIKTTTLQDALSQVKRKLHIRVLTRGDACDFLLGSSNLAALKLILDIDLNAEIKLMSNLHAKVYIADSSRAIVTSGNLTPSGFGGNIELGLLIDRIDDESEVAHLCTVVDEWFSNPKNLKVDKQWFELMAQDVERLRKEYTKLGLPKGELPAPNPDLQGGRVDPTKSKHSTKNAEQGVHVVNEEDTDPARVLAILASPENSPIRHRIVADSGRWVTEIEEWFYTKGHPELKEGFIYFIKNAIEFMAPWAFDAAWFGTFKDGISIIVGNFALVDIDINAAKRIMLLVDKPDLGYRDGVRTSCRECEFLSETSFRFNAIFNLSNEVWAAYRSATEQAQGSFMTKTMSETKMKKKLKLSEIVNLEK